MWFLKVFSDPYLHLLLAAIGAELIDPHGALQVVPEMALYVFKLI